MSRRKWVEEKLDGMFEFFDILRTTLSETSKSLRATVRGDTYEDGTHEEYPDAEVIGLAGFVSRPKDDSNGDGAQAFGIRTGDEIILFGTRDTRYQIQVVEGEAAIYALGADGSVQSAIRCLPDGTVKIEGDSVKIGGDNATEWQALGLAIAGYFSDLRTWLAAHGHSDHGQPPIVAPPAVPQVRSFKHRVEP